jgi:hypothetical protein
MGVYAIKYHIPTKYTILNLLQVYMLGHWNCLHLLVRSVVSPDHAKDLSRVLLVTVSHYRMISIWILSKQI